MKLDFETGEGRMWNRLAQDAFEELIVGPAGYEIARLLINLGNKRWPEAVFHLKQVESETYFDELYNTYK